MKRMNKGEKIIVFKEFEMTNIMNSYFIRRIQDIQTNHNFSPRFITNDNLMLSRINK